MLLLKYNISNVGCGCGHYTRIWMCYIDLRRLKNEKSMDVVDEQPTLNVFSVAKLINMIT